MERYEDFEQVTRRALDYALEAAGRELDAGQKDALMAQYNDLERFDDVEEGLRRLKAAGHEMVVFSNGTPRMLDALMDREGFRPRRLWTGSCTCRASGPRTPNGGPRPGFPRR